MVVGRLLESVPLPDVRTMASQVAANAKAVGESWRDLQKFACAYGRNGLGVLVPFWAG